MGEYDSINNKGVVMLDSLKTLFTSKKFYMTILGTAICSGLALAGIPNEVILAVAGLFGVNIGSQGFVDANKPK